MTLVSGYATGVGYRVFGGWGVAWFASIHHGIDGLRYDQEQEHMVISISPVLIPKCLYKFSSYGPAFRGAIPAWFNSVQYSQSIHQTSYYGDLRRQAYQSSPVHTTTGCGEQGIPSAQPYLSHYYQRG
ncbi:uncharacterized protein BDV17DRAFT_56386 [Aspergillus undulatus]|uniref:uncharacterized protein n=1 Tax=Aspergillus undulatus TaxID=1810928 RepID=UPI003CCDD07A